MVSSSSPSSSPVVDGSLPQEAVRATVSTRVEILFMGLL
jgi:hypothetical protein